MIRAPTDGVNHFPTAKLYEGFKRPKRSSQPRGVPRKADVPPAILTNQLPVGGCRKYHSVKIDGLYRLQFLRDIIVRCMLYSIHLYGLYTCLCLQRAKARPI
ncbi:hypothetical protein NIB75_25815 [Bacteroides uniformis]|nr:hypothetical protein [Bacteroides uniformis]